MPSDQHGWPDPTRPGHPKNPDRSGPHLLRDSKGELHIDDWLGPDREDELRGWNAIPGGPENAVALGYTYVSPLYTEAEVAAREAAAAEAMRQQARVAAMRARFGPPSMWQVPGSPAGWHMDRDCTPEDAANHDNGCVDAMKAIASLPLPAPGALDRAREEAWREGMRDAMEIARSIEDEGCVGVHRISAAIRARMEESNAEG